MNMPLGRCRDLWRQPGHKLLDLIDERFTTANGHWRIAIHRCRQAFPGHVLEGRGIWEYTAASSQIARVQRQLENHRKLRRFAKFVLNYVAGDFRRYRERESHRLSEVERLVL
jgi:hypothetical protein